MNRRHFIAGLGGAAAWPLVARAQWSERMRRVGVLDTLAADDPEAQARSGAFLQSLQQLGWTMGRNVRVDTRWAAGSADTMRQNITDLVALTPDVMLATGTPSLGPLLQATRSIPIVFVLVPDPVGAGFVDSLARPGGNITGFVSFEYSMAGKWLETLKLVAPNTVRIAAIRDLASPSEMGMLGAIQAVMPAFAMPFVAVGGRDAAEFERAIVEFARQPN